ncbi:MAG TPA: carboxypeptidase-like regulatory domain-containing protein, partial [Pyrinomonadaceae bacterium]|nr:carboxypeptidase-like regulatory domain-containing protein [Pyrinomonadaceae bacterium]
TTFPIPVDPEVTAGFDQTLSTSDDIVQIPGSFSCVGCTITAVSGYTRSGSQSGDSSKQFTITFTATSTTAVIAYGAHISTRTDWGIENSAINISGSPYHNFVVDFPGANGGSRDLQLAASAVVYPAQITIIKAVTTLENTSTSTFEFDFTSSANFGVTGFTLVDNVVGSGGGGTASVTAGSFINFGAANSITITETNYQPNWSLLNITCVENPGGIPQTDNSTTNVPGRTATIILEEGEFVTCTFFNSQFVPTAAPASVSGRVIDSFGRGIYGARMTITDAQTGESWVALSNMLGYYTIEGPEAGGFYMLSVSHKRYSFADSTRTFSLNEDLVGMDFVANP